MVEQGLDAGASTPRAAKPEVPDEVVESWQYIVNEVARRLGAPLDVFLVRNIVGYMTGLEWPHDLEIAVDG